MIITAEDLLAMPIDKTLWELELEREITVKFFDGEITAPGGMTIIARYIWMLLDRYPMLPIKSSYHPQTLGILNPMTHARIAERIVLEDARDYHLDNGLEWDEQEEDVHVYRMANKLSNMIDLVLQKHVRSVDAIDFSEIVCHPEIDAINQRILNAKSLNPEDIAQAHKEIKHIILTHPDFDDNSVVQLARLKLVKIPQLLVSVGPIGFLTEINDVMFKYPIRSNYVRGMSKIFEPAIESRNATIASMYQEILMRDAEYMSRKLSLIGETIYNLHRVDCGSKRYTNQFVDDEDKLRAMDGMYHKVDENHRVVPIHAKSMKHLIGTWVELREPGKCEHPDRSGICEVCFSELSIQIPDLHMSEADRKLGGETLQISTNIGHTSVVATSGPKSQNVLGQKHNKELKEALRLELDMEEELYITLSDDGRCTFLKENFNPADLELRIAEEDARDIHELNIDNMESVVASKMTHIVSFGIVNRRTGDDIDIYVGEELRAGHMSRELLEFVATNGYELVHGEKVKVVKIDLAGWDSKQPFIIIPQISYSPVEAITDLENFILSIKPKKSKPGLNGYKDRGEALDTFYQMVKENECHLVHLCMIMLAVSAQDPANGDYRVPLPRDSGVPVSDLKIMYNASMGGALAYERHADIFSDPKSYIDDRRRPHPYDYHMDQKPLY